MSSIVAILRTLIDPAARLICLPVTRCDRGCRGVRPLRLCQAEMVARVDGNSTSGGRTRMGIIRSIFIERRIRYITVSFKGDGQELHGEVLEIMGLRGRQG